MKKLNWLVTFCNCKFRLIFGYFRSISGHFPLIIFHFRPVSVDIRFLTIGIRSLPVDMLISGHFRWFFDKSWWKSLSKNGRVAGICFATRQISPAFIYLYVCCHWFLFSTIFAIFFCYLYKSSWFIKTNIL